MANFQIVSPHLPAECIQAMDEMLAHNPDFIEGAWLGCDAGDHTVYAVVEALASNEAREKIPGFLRARTRVVEVVHRTPEQIRAKHDKVAEQDFGSEGSLPAGPDE